MFITYEGRVRETIQRYGKIPIKEGKYLNNIK
jgi:hypothetical protein